MAFGFPASYETEIEVTGPRQAIRESITSTIELLGWDFWVDESSNLFTAKVGMSVNSWGEEFVVSLADEPLMRIRSSCQMWQMFDWGRNKSNVERFLQIFSKRLSWVAARSGPPPAALDEAGRTPLERVIAEAEDQKESSESNTEQT